MLRIRRYGGHQNTKKRIYGGQSGNQPAPCTSAKGLTIGSQFAARFGGEETLLNLAYELEKARPSTDRWPEMSAHTI